MGLRAKGAWPGATLQGQAHSCLLFPSHSFLGLDPITMACRLNSAAQEHLPALGKCWGLENQSQGGRGPRGLPCDLRWQPRLFAWIP